MMTLVTSTECVVDLVAHYRARFATEHVTQFARDLVIQAQPATPTRAKAFLFAAVKLATFADAQGLEL